MGGNKNVANISRNLLTPGKYFFDCCHLTIRFHTVLLSEAALVRGVQACFQHFLCFIILFFYSLIFVMNKQNIIVMINCTQKYNLSGDFRALSQFHVPLPFIFFLNWVHYNLNSFFMLCILAFSASMICLSSFLSSGYFSYSCEM